MHSNITVDFGFSKWKVFLADERRVAGKMFVIKAVLLPLAAIPTATKRKATEEIAAAYLMDIGNEFGIGDAFVLVV